MNLEERYYDELDACPGKALALIEELETKLDHMKDHLEGVIDAMYGEESVSKLEWHLEEVLSEVGLRLPRREPKIEKINCKMSRFFKELSRMQGKFLNGEQNGVG